MRKSPSVCAAGHAKGPGRCKECRKKYHAQYHRANRDQILVRKSNDRRENPDRYVASSSKYRAKKKGLLGTVSSDIAQKLMALQKGKCACCGAKLGKDFHLDHITPLSKGGKHEDANLQLLTATCNLQKNAKDPIDFMQERGFLI